MEAVNTPRAFAYGFTGSPAANLCIAGMVVIGLFLLFGAFA